MSFHIGLCLVLFLARDLPGQNFKDLIASEGTAALVTFLQEYDVNHCSRGVNALISSAINGDLEKMRWLIDRGANIDLACSKGKNALMYAAVFNQIEAGKLLVENGADITLRDDDGYGAWEIAAKSKQTEFLQMVILPAIDQFAGMDGPYFHQTSSGWRKTSYRIAEEGIEAQQTDFETLIGTRVEVCSPDGNLLFDFEISQMPEIQPDIFEMPSKLFAVSDIEGNFEAFANLLKAGQVIDEDWNWQYGDGHLALVGDFFDRGEQVTEVLWLIYKLEQEAMKAGGRVHFVLGNHEEMNLKGDVRYVARKYFANASLIQKSYPTLYGPQAFFTQWLKTKHAMVLVGDILFTHGGLSPEFAQFDLSLSEINSIARQHIANSYEANQQDSLARLVFDGYYGPLWYRGHMSQGHTTKQLVQVLKQYDAKKIVIGHTPVDDITVAYGGRLINIDVPHAKNPKAQKALEIQGKTFTAVHANGDRKALKVK